MKRRTWVSDNGKYRVNVRKYDDGDVLSGYWKVVDGKLKNIRYKDLPNYVVAKIEELKKEVN